MDAVEARELKKTYTTYLRRGMFKREKKLVEALKGVSFSVKYGEVFGLLGPNGAGKTTTVKILSTLLIPDGGKAIVGGYDVVDEAEKVRERIGVALSVEKGFFWKLTGRENLKYFGMLKGLKGRELNDRVDFLLKELGLEELKASDKLYEEYSLGMKARLSLARAMLTDPPILILDEPTLGLDPPSARVIRALLVRLAREEGKAVLITTHNMFEAELICDRVAIINNGKIAALGRVDELKRMVNSKTSINILVGDVVDLRILEKTLQQVLSNVPSRLILTPDGRVRIRLLSSAGEEDTIISEVVKAVAQHKGRVYRVEVEQPNLEDVFIKLTGGQL